MTIVGPGPGRLERGRLVLVEPLDAARGAAPRAAAGASARRGARRCAPRGRTRRPRRRAARRRGPRRAARSRARSRASSERRLTDCHSRARCPSTPRGPGCDDRSFHHSRYDEAFLAARRESDLGVPAGARLRPTVGPIVAGARRRCASAGAIDEIVVIDGDSTRRDGADRRSAPARRVHAEARADALLRPGARQGRRDVARAQRARGRSRLLPRRRPARVLDRTTRSACSARCSSSRRSSSSRRTTAARSTTATWSSPTAAGRVNHLLARPRLAIFHPLLAGRPPAARGRDRGAPRAARAAARSRPATASRSRCCSTCSRRSGSTGMAQVDLDPTTTATSRSRR